MARNLADEDIKVLMLDGEHIAERCVVVALAITVDGTKKPVGLWDGSTENKTVVRALLADAHGDAGGAVGKYPPHHHGLGLVDFVVCLAGGAATWNPTVAVGGLPGDDLTGAGPEQPGVAVSAAGSRRG